MAWWDFYKLFTYAFEDDPISKQRKGSDLSGAGVSQADAVPNIRQDGSYWGGSGNGLIRLRDTNDFIDLSSVSNRQSRYKEYERLRNVAEIEMVMTVLADEACLYGETLVSTLMDGLVTIKWLTENKKEPFLVYCWDFEKNDYSLGWAYDPRLVKKAKTVRVTLDDGSDFIATPDHRVLLRDGNWSMAGELKKNDKLMPFYRIKPDRDKTKLDNKQFPRIFTFNGWKHERQFIDEWRRGKDDPEFAKVNQATRLLTSGLTTRQVAKVMGHQWFSISEWLRKEGFSTTELQWLGNKQDERRVVSVQPWKEVDVYDLSVRDHENFCGESCIFHNCQKGENDHRFEIKCANEKVSEELHFLFFHRKMLNFDKRTWTDFKNMCIMGDHMYEIVIDPENPSDGILKVQELPVDSMYRIETTKGKLYEFQQSAEGPDYESLARSPVAQSTQADLQQAKAVKFSPHQIVHMRIGDDRKQFYPYGVSLIEPARGPAHQLRLMEDAMVVYRLCLAGNTRIPTKFGWKYLKDIKKGDEIFSYSIFDGKMIPAKVVDWSNNGKQKTFKVKSKHIEITGNATHPIWIERDGIRKYVLIQDLMPKKDKLITCTRDEEIPVAIPTIVGEKWAKLSDSQRTAFRNGQYENISELMRNCIGEPSRIKQFLYTEGKALPYEQAVNVCNIFELNPANLKIVNKGQVNSERIHLPEYVTEEFAKLFGFLIGDGSVAEYNLCFAAGTDPDQNAYYANLLTKFFGHVTFEEDKRTSTPHMGKYVVSSSIASKILQSMGYIAGAHNKRIPQWAFTAPKNIRRAFVEGISNADGCERYTNAGTWFSTIELCNKDLIADIKEIWSSIGLCSGKLGHRNRVGGHEIEPGRTMPDSESYSITISNLPLPKTENICSVTEDAEQDVFDITVNNEEHNFIANGIPVHNSRAPERRVFYIDVAQLPPYKAEAFMERIKDQFRKKKVATNKAPGASSVEERWHAPAADEDYWLPIRPNSNTRIETLPGASNLGEIDDAVYFRNKLFTALNFPKNYFSNEDPQSTRIALSAQDIKFARMIERLQSHFEDGLWAIADRHLRLRGFPEEDYDDLIIKMTPPSDWREMSRAEVVTSRYNNAGSLKGSMLYSDFDILTKILKHDEDEAQEMLSRMKIQKLEDLKLQVLAQNPQLLGVGVPGEGETEISSEPNGPNPMLSPQGGPQGIPQGGEGQVAIPGEENSGEQNQPQQKIGAGASMLPEPEEAEIKKYDLEVQSYSKEQDKEEIDYTQEDN